MNQQMIIPIKLGSRFTRPAFRDRLALHGLPGLPDKLEIGVIQQNVTTSFVFGIHNVVHHKQVDCSTTLPVTSNGQANMVAQVEETALALSIRQL